MLLIDEVLPAIPFKHEATGFSAMLTPLEPADHTALLKASRNEAGELDTTTFYGKVAVKAIKSWEGASQGGQPAPCDEATKERFGRRFANTIMPEVLKKATDLRSFVAEVGEAKKG